MLNANMRNDMRIEGVIIASSAEPPYRKKIFHAFFQ